MKIQVSIWHGATRCACKDLVNQLLDLQKSEVGRREEPLIRIDVHLFLATAGLFFAEAALAKGVHFELRRDGAVIDPSEDDGEPVYIHADIDGLEKIVFNYLANALKFHRCRRNHRFGLSLVGVRDYSD